MFLTQLIYASKVNNVLNPEDIETILASAHRNNAAMGVTGLLCFSQNAFLQCLEGSRMAVNNIYHRILNDKRHHSPVILHYATIVKRDFVHWAMGYVGQTRMVREQVLAYSGSHEFDPFTLSADNARGLLLELSTSLPVETGTMKKAG